MNKSQRGSLIVLSGPSGVGKSTLIAQVLRRRPDLYFSVSFTTREPREGEVNGVDYFFVDVPEFERMIRDGELLEHACYSNDHYGTSAKLVDEKLDAGIDVLLDIEVVGSKIVHDERPDTPMIFILPPSLEALASRLRGRGTEPEEVVVRRLARAREELKEIDRYDYLVVNDVVDEAAEEVLAILRAERCRASRRIDLVREDLGLG